MVERDDDHALFVENGVPVKFCFHRSVTQGRGQITRDVERHGGNIVQDERRANVLLVDEQEDIALLRRRYYSSTERYRLSLYVEPRGFVQTCIRSGHYGHVGPIKHRMPGLAPGGVVRQRTAFTEEDRDHLAYYLATRFPTRDGRMGNSAYKDLVRLAETDDPSWAWAKRHTFHSWREHYKMNPVMMDARIDMYLARLENVGHHLGHDARRHVRQEEEEEEEEGEEEEEEEQEERRQDRERRQPAPPAAAAQAQEHLARHGRDLVPFDEEEGEDVQAEELQRAKRHHVHAQQQRDIQETQAKRARVSDVSLDETRASGVKTGRSPSTKARETDSETEESQEVEGSDLFGDRAYEEERRLEFNGAQEVEFPMPYSPRASPVPEPDDAPLSTQATLVASPHTARKEPVPTPGPTPAKVVEPQAPVAKMTAPSSPQQTSIVTEERVIIQRTPVRGASAQPGPSVPKETRARGGVAPAEAPYRNTRARSRSVEPQPQLQPKLEPRRGQPRTGLGSKGKAKAETLMPIEEDVQDDEMPMEVQHAEGVMSGVPVMSGLSTRETFEDEMAVQGLLEVESGAPEDEVGLSHEGEDEDLGNVDVGGDEDGREETDGDDDDDDMVFNLPRYQMIEVSSPPTDSDDAETHGSLVRATREGFASEDDAESGSEQEQEQNEDSDEEAERIERMARGSLHAVPRITRSQSQAHTQPQPQTQTQVSPRRTRSVNQARQGTVGHVFPNPGTKASTVVDRVQEKQMPYTPPKGTRAARVVRGRTRRG